MAAAAWETAALPSEFAAWSTTLLLGGGLAFLAYVLWSSVAAAPATATLPPARSQQAEQRHSGSSGEEEPSSDEEELGIGGFRVSSTEPSDRVAMAEEAVAALLAQVDEAKTAGNALYQSKDWAGAVSAYSAGLKQVPDLEEVEVPTAAMEACAVLFTNRSAARYALQQYVGSLSDAQRAQELDPKYWKAHWRVGSALLNMEARVERSEQMIRAFELCLSSPTLPEAKRETMEKYLENARHRLRTGKDKYKAADCVLM